MAKKSFLFQATLKGNTDRFIDTGEPVKFNGSNPESGIYAVDGIITVTQPGQYFINWFVAQSTGMSKDGHNFALKIGDGDPDLINSSHVKIAGGSGFVTLDIEAGQVPLTLSLVNAADATAVLSSRSQAKAGIAFYGVNLEGVLDPDDLSYFFTDLAKAHVQFNSPIRTVVASQEPIPFNDMFNLSIFNGSELDLVDSTIRLPLTGRYMFNWHVPVMSSDFAEEAELAFEVKRPGDLTFEVATTSYIPLPIGMVSGTTVMDLPADTLVKLTNALNSIEFSKTANEFFFNRLFYNKKVLSGPNPPVMGDSVEVGDSGVFVEVDNGLVGYSVEAGTADSQDRKSVV